MKKLCSILFLSLVLFLSDWGSGAQAIVITAQNNTVPTSVQNKNIPYYNYLRFYNIDSQNFKIAFKQLNEEEEKDFFRTLTKDEKKDYKYAKKIQQMIDRGAWGEVLYKYPDFYPALIQYYQNCKDRNLYEEALRIMDKIRMGDRYNQIFSKDSVNHELAQLYIQNKQYLKAIDILKQYENSYNDRVYADMASCYFGLQNYQKAIYYLNKTRNKQYSDNELLYSCYIESKDMTNAHKIAVVLSNQKYNFENLMRLQTTSSNDAEKLKYAYQARNTTNDTAEIIMINKFIADLEQKKLDNQMSALHQFIKKPNWEFFRSQLPETVSTAELCQKQDEFFRTAERYLVMYNGQQLTNAFNSLNQDFTNYVQQKKNEYYQALQLQMQQAQLQAQQQQQYIQQQLIEQQRMENYIRMQRVMEMGNRAYYSNPLIYDPYFW